MRKGQPAKHRLKLVGKRFGRLLVIRDAGTRNSGDKAFSIWECLCDCGNTKVITGSNLQTGDAISCGCYNKERTAAMNKLPPGEYRVNRIMGIYKKNARDKNLPFKLTREQLRGLISSDCYYCGGEPKNSHTSHGHKIVYQGIDRMDNSKGYTSDNVVPCCIVCNKMKKAMSHDEFVIHIHKIATSFSVEPSQADYAPHGGPPYAGTPYTGYETCGG